eukprot:GHVH01004498.1.p1 GENE.GHVH01004498.1~~GHVH01004498.1.p1  ORF type:complete len:197 (+),score=28.84 GHVH01004498.1:25-591(+)
MWTAIFARSSIAFAYDEKFLGFLVKISIMQMQDSFFDGEVDDQLTVIVDGVENTCKVNLQPNSCNDLKGIEFNIVARDLYYYTNDDDGHKDTYHMYFSGDNIDFIAALKQSLLHIDENDEVESTTDWRSALATRHISLNEYKHSVMTAAFSVLIVLTLLSLLMFCAIPYCCGMKFARSKAKKCGYREI